MLVDRKPHAFKPDPPRTGLLGELSAVALRQSDKADEDESAALDLDPEEALEPVLS